MSEEITYQVGLTDDNIEALANGETICLKVSDGVSVNIQQRIVKDALAPIIERDKKIFSKSEVDSMRRSSEIDTEKTLKTITEAMKKVSIRNHI